MALSTKTGSLAARFDVWVRWWKAVASHHAASPALERRTNRLAAGRCSGHLPPAITPQPSARTADRHPAGYRRGPAARCRRL
jgi:hypothetical protein